MTSETDADLVTRLRAMWLETGTDDIDGDEMERLFALARRGAEVQWRPIEEAPKDGTHILVTNGKRQAAAYWWPAVWMGTTHCGMNEPTHWMPLPPPPAGETNER